MARIRQKKLSDRDRLLTRPDKPLPTTEDPRKPSTACVDPKVLDPKGPASDPRDARIDYTA